MNPTLDELIEAAIATCERINAICERAEARIGGGE